LMGRGMSCVLTVDESGFDGISPFLLGLVLERYLPRLVSMNTFTQVTLRSEQRGEIICWPPRTGTRGVI